MGKLNTYMYMNTTQAAWSTARTYSNYSTKQVTMYSNQAKGNHPVEIPYNSIMLSWRQMTDTILYVHDNYLS